MRTVLSRNEDPSEESTESTVTETCVSDTDTSSVLGTNTYRNFSRGRNPEHHLEDLHSVGRTVVVHMCGSDNTGAVGITKYPVRNL